MPPRDDLDTQAEDGVYPLPISADTRRSSTAYDYLTPEVRRRPNLQLRTGAEVRRLLFDGRRFTGVELHPADGAVEVVSAPHGVLAAGAIHTPHLLIQSGVGPEAEVARVGRSVVQVLPGVGAEFQNHVFVHLGAALASDARQDPAMRAYTLACARLSSGVPGGAPADLLLSFISRASAHRHGNSVGLIGVQLYAPRSRGWIGARGPDAPPEVVFNLLSDEADAARMVLGARHAAALLADEAVAPLVSDPFLAPRRIPIRLLNRPGLVARTAGVALDMLAGAPSGLRRPLMRLGMPGVRFLDTLGAEDDFAAAVLQSAAPMFHLAGSCGIGRAVDPSLRVIGLEGLWAADASVMPVVPRANTNVPTLMVAEKAADLIRSALRGASPRRAA